MINHIKRVIFNFICTLWYLKFGSINSIITTMIWSEVRLINFDFLYENIGVKIYLTGVTLILLWYEHSANIDEIKRIWNKQ